jgi:hypothetical protein
MSITCIFMKKNLKLWELSLSKFGKNQVRVSKFVLNNAKYTGSLRETAGVVCSDAAIVFNLIVLVLGT